MLSVRGQVGGHLTITPPPHCGGGVTVRCPPTSLQAVAGRHYCHPAHKQKRELETIGITTSLSFV